MRAVNGSGRSTNVDLRRPLGFSTTSPFSRWEAVTNWSLCRRSLSHPALRHHRAGVRARLHGAGLEAAHLHRRRRHHRLLRGLPRGDRRRAGQVARGQHPGHQREGLQGEPKKQVLNKIQEFVLLTADLNVRCRTWGRTWSTSSRCELPTWQVLASHRCPATPSCARSGPSPCQVCSAEPPAFTNPIFGRRLWPSSYLYVLDCRASVRPADPGGAQRLAGAAVEGSRLSGSRPRQRLLRGHEGGRGSARGLEGSQQQGHGEDLHEGSSSLILSRFFCCARSSSSGMCWSTDMNFVLNCRLRIWRKQSPTCSVCAPRTMPASGKPRTWRSRSQLQPSRVRREDEPFKRTFSWSFLSRTSAGSPGTTEIVVDVDDDGVISLNFECCDMTQDSKFVWSKNYQEITDSSRVTSETKGNKWGFGRDIFLLRSLSITLPSSWPLLNSFPAGPKLFSTARRRRMSAFTPVWSPTPTALRPATRSLRKVGTKPQRKTASNWKDEISLWPRFPSLLPELKRLLQISHDHKFPSECFSLARHRCSLCSWREASLSLKRWLSRSFPPLTN